MIDKSTAGHILPQQGLLYRVRTHADHLARVAALVALSFATAEILVLTNGNIFAGAALPVIAAIVLVSYYRLEWGFCIFAGMVLLFDQFLLRGFDPITFYVAYFLNLKEIPYLPSFNAGVVNPAELHLMLLFSIWIIHTAIRRTFEITRVPLTFVLLIWFAWVGISFGYGLSRGGDFLKALWETRAMCYFGIMYFFVPQIIRTKEHISTLFWVCIGAISIKALQGVGRFVALGFKTWGYDALTSSEDPVFMITIIFLFILLLVFGGHSRQKKVIGGLLFFLFLGMYVGQRRATYASFAVTFIAFLILLPKKEARPFIRAIPAAVVLFLVYLALYWNTYGRIGMIAQQVKSIVFTDPDKISGRDYLSNLYREYENYNLAITVQRAPVMGIGFGNMYDNPISFYGLERTGMLGYIPHNSIFWLLAKTGSIGFFLFFFFLDALLFGGAMTFVRLKDPYLKAICALCMLALINQIVVAYVEMQLTFFRNMIYLGILAGLLPTLRALATDEPETIQSLERR